MVSNAGVSDVGFESLVSELSTRASLTKEKIAVLIQEKKAKVGGGYLTDQGALFLIASELGVSLDYDHAKPASLSDLTADRNDSVTVISRVLSIGAPKVFTRKTDSRKGVRSLLIVYDNRSTASINMWDQAAINFVNELNIGPGDLVKISNGYTRSAVDGSVSLNLGEKGIIEKIPEENNGEDKSTKTAGRISTLQEKQIESFSSIPENGKALVIRGKVEGEVRRVNFTRSDGSSSEYCSFTIADEKDIVSRFRVVIWGNSGPGFVSLRDSEIVTLLNVRTKLSNYQNTVSVEIHGDESTCVLERWDEIRAWMKELAKNFALSGTQDPASADKQKATTLTKNANIPFVARIISLRESANEGRSYLLLVDSQKRKISLTISGAGLMDLEQLKSDDVVVCKPETIDADTLKGTTTREKSIQKVHPKRQDIPMASSFFSNLEDLEQSKLVSLEVMCLTDSVSREIQTKDGLIRRNELTVADHTGEIKVYGWRNLSKLLENFSAGDRIILSAVEVQSHEGKKFIVLKNYSTIRKDSA
ncbi:MAG: hypothetical protein ACREBS_10675 [Nitrososphaerales archaeon]